MAESWHRLKVAFTCCAPSRFVYIEEWDNKQDPRHQLNYLLVKLVNNSLTTLNCLDCPGVSRGNSTLCSHDNSFATIPTRQLNLTQIIKLFPNRTTSLSQLTMTTRIRQACDACRLRKVKCNGSRPCPQCAHLNLPCVFSSQHAGRRHPRVRGRLVAELRCQNNTSTKPSRDRKSVV